MARMPSIHTPPPDDVITHPGDWRNLKVLQLNFSLEPLSFVEAHVAVIDLINGEAKSFEDFDPVIPIRSQHLTIPLPRIVEMKRYIQVPHNFEELTEASEATALRILRRDKSRCGYCGEYATTIDHVIPRSRGGLNTWGNLIAACAPCNGRKANRTPEEAKMPKLWEPGPPVRDLLQKQIWRKVTRNSRS